MPLLDHFHPPLSKQRYWDSFFSAWADAIARSLNRDLLPPRYVAETYYKIWTAPEAILDIFEVNIANDERGPKVVAAIELVSPTNKDRPSDRRAFAERCASYMQQGISVMIVDVVTGRRGNLHAELLELLNEPVPTPARGTTDLYATAYRPLLGAEQSRLELWAEPLAVGSPLPTLPLWLSAELALPMDLEESYCAACAARRIEMA